MRGAFLCFGLALLSPPAFAYDYRTVDSDGCRLAYTDYGSGEAVIFLHGFASDFEYLGKIGDTLSAQFRVIGLHQRGHGRSCKPADADGYGKHFATDVLNLMDRLRIADAHVVGHSMGGIVSLYLAANHPGRIRSAVTIGNGLFLPRELTLIGWLMRGKYAWQDVKEFFGAEESAASSNDEAALVLAVRSLRDLSVSAEQAAAMKVPVLAARGGPDDDPRNTVERLAATNPSVRTVRVESANHGTVLDSAEFRSALKAFLTPPTTRLSAD